MNNDENTFSILLEKYIKSEISDVENDKLNDLLKDNIQFQSKFTESLILESAIQNVMNSKSAVIDEVNKLKRTSSPKKRLSNKFQKKSNQSKFYNKIYLIAAAIIILGTSASYIKSYLPSKTPPFQNFIMNSFGDVKVTRNQKIIKTNIPISLQIGDKITLGENSYSKIISQNNSYVLLNENTKIHVSKKGLFVNKGNLYASIQKDEKDYLKKYISTENSSFEIKGTIFEISKFKSREKRLAVEEGIVLFKINNQQELIKAGYSLESSLDGSFKQIQKIPKEEPIAPWKSYFKYSQNKDVVFIDNFNRIKAKPYWSVQNKKNNKLILQKNKSILEMQTIGKSEISFTSPKVDLMGKTLSTSFKTISPKGIGPYEYGYIIYINDKVYLHYSIIMKEQIKGSYYFTELIKEQNNQIKNETPKRSDTPPDIDLLTNFTPQDIAPPSKVKTKPILEKRQNKTLNKSAQLQSVNNYYFKFYLKGLSDNTSVNWGIDSFIVTRDEILTNKILNEL